MAESSISRVQLYRLLACKYTVPLNYVVCMLGNLICLQMYSCFYLNTGTVKQ